MRLSPNYGYLYSFRWYYGIVVPQGINKIRKAIPEILENAENELSHRGRELFADLYEQIIEVDKRITQYDVRLSAIFKSNESCQRISQVEGVGVITATAIIAMVGDAKMFKNGRHLSAYLGLVPKQHSSGNKNRLLGISKRGDTYIRTLLIHGARSVVKISGSKTDTKSVWITSLKERRGTNKASVALANKNARVIWALLAKGGTYEKAA